MSARASTSFLSHLNPWEPVRELFSRREILWQFTVRNFHLKHKGSYLGILWAVLNPLLVMGLFFIVFGLTLKVKFNVLPDERPVDTALAILIGITVYHFLSEVISQAPGIITTQPNLVKKVVFPLTVLPVANLGATFFNFLVSLTLVMLGQIVFGRGLPLTALWIPVIVLPLILLAIGLGWLLAALGVFFRDITQVTQLITMLLMYASAVFYPSAQIRSIPELWAFLRFNPVLQTIELLRDVLLWDQPANLVHLGGLYLAGGLVFLIGHACFASLRPTFADVL